MDHMCRKQKLPPGINKVFHLLFYSRKKGLYTRDKSKLFLKQSCDSTDGIWRVKVINMTNPYYITVVRF